VEIWELNNCNILHEKDKSLYELKRKLETAEQLENRSIESIRSEKQSGKE
jgi:Zn-finger protein